MVEIFSDLIVVVAACTVGNGGKASFVVKIFVLKDSTNIPPSVNYPIYYQ